MANLFYANESENKCRLYFTEKLVYEDEKIMSEVFLDINIDTKEVQKTHDFFHKILIFKILNSEFTPLEINFDKVKELPFFAEEGFKKLNEFLLEIIEELNKTIKSISEQ